MFPVDWINKLINADQLSPEAQSAVVNYFGLQTGVIVYTKALTKVGKMSDQRLGI